MGEDSEESIKDLTNLMVRDYPEFFEKRLGENSLYEEWFSQTLKSLEKNELPYAFADNFGPTDYWKTSNNNKMATLPNEEQYY